MGNRGGGGSGFAGKVRGGCTLESKLLSCGHWVSRGQVSRGRVLRRVRGCRILGNESPAWAMWASRGQVSHGWALRRVHLHFGKQAAHLGNERHGVRFAGACVPAGERPLHFGKQVARLGNGRHGVRFRGCGCSGG